MLEFVLGIICGTMARGLSRPFFAALVLLPCHAATAAENSAPHLLHAPPWSSICPWGWFFVVLLAVWMGFLHRRARRAAIEARGNADKFMSLFANMNEGATIHKVVLDGEGRFVDALNMDCNEAFLRMMTMTRAEFDSRMLSEIPGARKNFDILARVSASGRPEKLVLYIEFVGKYFELSIFVPFPGHLAIVGEDVTERKLAEDKVRDLNETMKRVFSSVDEGIILMDMDSKLIKDCNRSVADIFGHTREEMIGKCPTIYHESEKAFEDFLKSSMRILETEKFHKSELLLRRKSGELFNAELVVCKPFDLRGENVSVGVVRDISERKRAEEALRESEGKFRGLFEGMNEASTVHHLVRDEKGEAVDLENVECNAAFETILGIPREKFVGRRLSQVHGSSRYFEVFMRVARTGAPEKFELSMDGGRKCFKMSVFSPKKDYIGVVGEDISERKELEAKLRQYADIIMNSKMGLCIYKREKTELGDSLVLADVNTAGKRMLRLSERPEAEVKGRRVDELFPRIGDTYFISSALMAMDMGEPVILPDFEYGDDSLGNRVYSMQFVPLHEAHVGVIFEDVTDKMQTDEKLRRLNETMDKTLSSLDEAVLSIDPRRRVILDCNTPTCAMFGYTEDELKGAGTRILHLSDESYDRFAENSYNNIAVNGVFKSEYKFRRRTGEVFDVEYFVRPIYDRDGRVDFVVVVLRDVTTRKKAENELKASEEKHRMLMNALQVGVWQMDGEGRIVYANPKMLEYLKIDDMSKIIGRDRRHFIKDSEVKILSVDGGNTDYLKIIFEGVMRNAMGRKFSVLISSIFMISGDKRHEFLVECFLDITAMKEAQANNEKMIKQLIESEKMATVGVLAAGVAHEINNPNNFIMLNLGTLQKAWVDMTALLEEKNSEEGGVTILGMPFEMARDRVGNMLRSIHEGSDRIKNIVMSLKDYSRKEPARAMFPADINKVVESAVTIVGGVLNKATIDFRVEYLPEPRKIVCNPQKIEQVVINLLQNACEALTSKKQKIRLAVSSPPDSRHVCVSVSDEGSGMSEESVKKATVPFYTTKRDSGGTGLGLSVSEGIVKEHNGRLEFESAPGRGTTVRLILPEDAKKETK